MLKIAIIGGGPAGFIAAIIAKEAEPYGVSIDIFDKNKPLKSILWTGNGRCNLTNEIYNFKELATHYPRGEKFLYSAFSRFGVKNTIEWFETNGVNLYTQSDNRVFPTSNDANTVRDFLINKAGKLGIKIYSNDLVIDIIKNNENFTVKTEKNEFIYDKVIVATGGNFKKPEFSGYEFAEKMGHSVTPLKQALTALISKEKWTSRLAGVSVQQSVITAFFNNKKIISAQDDFVFTHEGISGPLAFKISSYCAFLEYSQANPLVLEINFVPDKSFTEVDKELLEEFDKNSKKSILNIIKDYIPKSLSFELLQLADIDPDKKASQISKDERKAILKLLTQTQLNIKSPKPDGEIVTAGGVDLDEVDSKTMESKLVKNLYFCGEVLNIDGLTGGFNLQACWSTGYIAGINSVKHNY